MSYREQRRAATVERSLRARESRTCGDDGGRREYGAISRLYLLRPPQITKGLGFCVPASAGTTRRPSSTERPSATQCHTPPLDVVHHRPPPLRPTIAPMHPPSEPRKNRGWRRRRGEDFVRPWVPLHAEKSECADRGRSPIHRCRCRPGLPSPEQFSTRLFWAGRLGAPPTKGLRQPSHQARTLSTSRGPMANPASGAAHAPTRRRRS